MKIPFKTAKAEGFFIKLPYDYNQYHYWLNEKLEWQLGYPTPLNRSFDREQWDFMGTVKSLFHDSSFYTALANLGFGEETDDPSTVWNALESIGIPKEMAWDLVILVSK